MFCIKVTIKDSFYRARLAQSLICIIRESAYEYQDSWFESNCGQEFFILYFFFRFPRGPCRSLALCWIISFFERFSLNFLHLFCQLNIFKQCSFPSIRLYSWHPQSEWLKLKESYKISYFEFRCRFYNRISPAIPPSLRFSWSSPNRELNIQLDNANMYIQLIVIKAKVIRYIRL